MHIRACFSCGHKIKKLCYLRVGQNSVLSNEGKSKAKSARENDLWSRWGLSRFLRGAVTNRVLILLSDMILVYHG